MTERGIPFDERTTKAELLSESRNHKVSTLYVNEVEADDHGHHFVFLPVRHCELNPIELIWAQVKRFVAQRNTTFKMKDVEALVREGLDRVTSGDWKNAISHVHKIEEQYWESDRLIDALDPVIIPLDDSDTDSD